MNVGIQGLGLTMIWQSDTQIWASIQRFFFSPEFKAYCSWIPVSEFSINNPKHILQKRVQMPLKSGEVYAWVQAQALFTPVFWQSLDFHIWV